MPDVLSLFLLAFVALIIIGPERLPQGLEALWLGLTDYRRTQAGEQPLGSIHNARIVWTNEKNSFFALIQFLYGVADHLKELRWRLLRSLIAFSIFFILTLVLAQQLLALLIRPINLLPVKPIKDAPINQYILGLDVTVPIIISTPSGPVTGTITIPQGTELPLTLNSTTPVALHPTEIFSTYVKIALLASFALALPFLAWEIMMFLRGPKNEFAALSASEWAERRATLTEQAVAHAEKERDDVYQGLTAREIRPLYFLVPLAALFFIGGVAFAYFIILPAALAFLFGQGGDLVQALPSLDDYTGFAMAIIFWVGLTFETPLIMFFLARFKIITARQFARQWRYAVVLITIIAAVVTPTTDPVNLALVAVPMLLLYVLGILFARFA